VTNEDIFKNSYEISGLQNQSPENAFIFKMKESNTYSQDHMRLN